MGSLRVVRFLLCLSVLVPMLWQPARATHYRGGTMSAEISAAGVLTVTAETQWRKEEPGEEEDPLFPVSGVARTGAVDSTEGPFPIGLQILDENRTVLFDTQDESLDAPDIAATTTSIDSSDPFFEVRTQVFGFDLSEMELGSGTYILYWVDAARIEGLHNVSSDLFEPGSSQSPFSLEVQFVYDETERSTPRIVSQVVTTVVKGQPYSNNLNAAGDSTLAYDLIVGSDAPRYGPTTAVPGLTVNAAGQLEISAASTALLESANAAGEPGGDYVFKVEISDADGQHIEQEVLLDVVEAPNRACAISVSDEEPTVAVGGTIELTLTATDPDEEDALVISDFPVLAHSTLTQTGTNPVQATYEFTPSLSQVGTLGVNFTAEDDGDPPLSCLVNVQIEVEANTPAVPIVSAAEESSGLVSNARTGAALAGAGDLDGDGFQDVIAGAPGFMDGAIPVEAGAAAIYLGSMDRAELRSPDVIFTGEAAHDRAGSAVAGDFTLDLDGIPTPVVLVGAEQVNREEDPAAPTGPGKVYLIFFDVTDAVHYPNLGDPNQPDTVSLSLVGQPGGIPGVVFHGEEAGDQAGFALAAGFRLSAGLVQDFAVGAPGADNLHMALDDTGVVYVVFGEDPILSTPFSGVPVDLGRVANGGPDEIAGVRYEGEGVGDGLGRAVAFVGDVVGDSGDDLAMGAPFVDTDPTGGGAAVLEAGGVVLTDAGAAYVAAGGTASAGIIEVCDLGDSATAGAQIRGDQPGENLGESLGRGSVLIGAPFYDVDPARGDAGRVVHATSKLPQGVFPASSVGDPLDPDALDGAIFVGAVGGDRLGEAVAGVGDVTGDGIDDVVMGAPFSDPNPTEGGTVYLAEGRTGGPALQGIIEVCDLGVTEPGRQLYGTQAGEHNGASVAATGDLNGNPTNDFAVGAPEKDQLSDEDRGTVYLVLESTNLAAAELSPVAHAGPDQVLECSSPGMNAIVLLDGSGSTDADSTPGTNDDIEGFDWSEGAVALGSGEQVSAPFALGVHAVLLTVTDTSGRSDTDDVSITLQDTTGPALSVPAPLVIECNSQGGVPATDPLVQSWLAEASASDACGGFTLGNDAAGLLPLGTTTVTFSAADDFGNMTTDTSTVTVVDTTPPAISVRLDPETLWPPNHHMKDVAAVVTASDVCGTPAVLLESVTSDEADNGAGDGNTVDDVQGVATGTPDFDFRLRAERAGGGDGRIYTAIYTASDGVNESAAAGYAVVPHDQGGNTDPVVLALEREGAGTLATWSVVPGAQSYDVVRGRVADIVDAGPVITLGAVTCIENDSLDESTAGLEDADLPEPGEAFFYVVEYFDGTSSSYGTESAGKSRAPGAGACQ